MFIAQTQANVKGQFKAPRECRPGMAKIRSSCNVNRRFQAPGDRRPPEHADRSICFHDLSIALPNS